MKYCLNNTMEKDKDKEVNSEGQSQFSLKDRVMASVKSGQLKMRPKWYFILRALLLAVGVALAALGGLYLASLLVFIAHETGISTVPVFGWPGIMLFLTSLPWVLILLVLLLIVILELMVRHYSFAYRLPLIYSSLGVLLLVGAGGLMVAFTPFHGMMANCPPLGGPPPCAMGVYGDLDPGRHNNIQRGTIARISGRNYIITNRNQEELLIVVSSRTKLPLGSDFEVGDKIVIMGEREGFRVEALGISPFDGRRLIPRKHQY